MNRAVQEQRVMSMVRDLAWRATRYAMQGRWVEHDVMVEALHAAVVELQEEQLAGLTPCDCAVRYHRPVTV